MITLGETAPLPKAPKHQVLLWLLLDLFPVLILGWEQWTGSHGTWQMVFCSSPVMLGLPSIFSRIWGPLHSLGHRLGQGSPLAARTFPLLLLLQPIYTCHRIREWMSPRGWTSKLSTTEVEGESHYLPPVLFRLHAFLQRPRVSSPLPRPLPPTNPDSCALASFAPSLKSNQDGNHHNHDHQHHHHHRHRLAGICFVPELEQHTGA